jgi:hypothetical protein
MNQEMEKWIMISLTLVAISLTIGLMQYAHGQTVDSNSNQSHKIPFTFDYNQTSFIISDVSVKQDTIGTISIIGLIQNNSTTNTIDGVSIAVQMFDKTNHLIGIGDVTPQSNVFPPLFKTGFEKRNSNVNQIPDHLTFQTMATNWNYTGE